MSCEWVDSASLSLCVAVLLLADEPSTNESRTVESRTCSLLVLIVTGGDGSETLRSRLYSDDLRNLFDMLSFLLMMLRRLLPHSGSGSDSPRGMRGRGGGTGSGAGESGSVFPSSEGKSDVRIFDKLCPSMSLEITVTSGTA